jgi:hypothetical protein
VVPGRTLSWSPVTRVGGGIIVAGGGFVARRGGIFTGIGRGRGHDARRGRRASEVGVRRGGHGQRRGRRWVIWVVEVRAWMAVGRGEGRRRRVEIGLRGRSGVERARVAGGMATMGTDMRTGSGIGDGEAGGMVIAVAGAVHDGPLPPQPLVVVVVVGWAVHHGRVIHRVHDGRARRRRGGHHGTTTPSRGGRSGARERGGDGRRKRGMAEREVDVLVSRGGVRVCVVVVVVGGRSDGDDLGDGRRWKD